MTEQAYDDDTLRAILTKAKVIAVVGYSDDPSRISYEVGHYLKDVGYTVYPINPKVAEIDGVKAYASLAEVPEKIDIVDVFRRSEFLADVIDAAIAVGAPVVWAQLGVSDPEAAEKGEAAGLTVIMDRCIMATHKHLFR